jgi:Rrf2 family protein
MLTMKTRYALRALVVLADAEPSDGVLGSEIAARSVVPKKFLEQILAALSQHGLVRSRKGRRGGYRLAMDAESISVAKVIEAIEGSIGLVPCLDRADFRCDGCDASCTLRHVLAGPHRIFASRLAAASIKDIADRRRC